MPTLPAPQWDALLPRIGARLRGRVATVRQQRPDERAAQIVLWRAPLQGLLLDDPTCVVIEAGYEAPAMELFLPDLAQIDLTLDDDDNPVALTFIAHDGTFSRLSVEAEP